MSKEVLARVSGREITEEDLNFLLENLDPQVAGQFCSPEGKKRLLDELINQELLYLEAIENGLDKEQEFIKEMDRMRSTVLKQFAMRKLFSSITVSEDEMKEYFNTHKHMFVNLETARASHILIDSKEKAEEVLAQINGGLSFEEAAKENSSCPSSNAGGDLGEFTRGKMVPEFEEAAFKLNVGEVSAPVKTQFGYHIIKLTNKVPEGEKTFEEVKSMVQNQALAMKQQATYLSKSADLQKKYEVEINK